MDTLTGILKYSPQERQPIQILTGSRTFDLWPLLEPTFWLLCGNDVVCEITNTSFFLALNATAHKYWVLYYEGSQNNMLLRKLGADNQLDMSSSLETLFSLWNGKVVTIEATREYCKISRP
ncbi:MAG: hypothetical protein HYT65_00880 [Candidatus Yanofskybacteria bacterium]|nr:hypothetical protein [Candidatus Yanofskybacteria bacterium]